MSLLVEALRCMLGAIGMPGLNDIRVPATLASSLGLPLLLQLHGLVCEVVQLLIGLLGFD